MVTIDDVRAVASTLPRSYEVVRPRGASSSASATINYQAFSRDEKLMGLAFLKEERERADRDRAAQVHAPLRESGPPVSLGGREAAAALDAAELRDLVIDAWAMVVPKKAPALHVVHE